MDFDALEYCQNYTGLLEEEQEDTKQRKASGTRRCTQQFFETAIEFTEEIEKSTRHKPLKVQIITAKL